MPTKIPNFFNFGKAQKTKNNNAAPEKTAAPAPAPAAPKKNTPRRIYVLDTNVLMHDGTALKQFEEHDIYLPMAVIEELDLGKKGQSDIARNVREVTRYLDQLLAQKKSEKTEKERDIKSGFKLEKSKKHAEQPRLFLQTENIDDLENINSIQKMLSDKADHQILAYTQFLKNKFLDRPVILVSKDINLRIKAAAFNLDAQDYLHDYVVKDIDILYKGYKKLNHYYWDQYAKVWSNADNDYVVLKWEDKEGRQYMRFKQNKADPFRVNQFLFSEVVNDKTEKPLEMIVRSLDADSQTANIEILGSYTDVAYPVFGINAKNIEQSFALHILMDESIDFITLAGDAGTGKTLLTLAAALEQTIEEKIFDEIIMTRATIPLGDDIGFLPGDEEEKMAPWMGALADNLEVLLKQQKHKKSGWERQTAQDFIKNYIKIRSVNFMRGRTFQKRFLIIDEAQNLSPKQMKALITRAGAGTKIVCLGNLDQIDTPYLTATTCGFAYVIERFAEWERAAHIVLAKPERSKLAEFASKKL